MPVLLAFALLTLVGCGATGLGGLETGIPSDANVDVGPTEFVETTNGTTAIFSKASRAVVASFATANLFACPGGYGSDPRVRYDALAGRWFFVSIGSHGSSTTYGTWCLAISQNSSALSPYSVYEIPTGVIGQYPDFPYIGISSNKVVLSGNVSNGTVTAIIDKVYLLNVGIPYFQLVQPSPINQPYLLVAHPALSATDGPIYMAGLDASGGVGMMRVRVITGTPLGTVTVTNTSIPLPAPAYFPPAYLPTFAGASIIAELLTSPYLDAVRGADRMWVAANVSCAPVGDVTRSCLRFYKVDGLNPFAPVVDEVAPLRAYGTSFFEPAVALDVGNDLVAIFARIPTGAYVGAAMVGRKPTDPAGTLRDLTVVAQGTAPVDVDTSCGSGCARWGDINGVGVDPSTGYTVYAVGQYPNSSSPFYPVATFIPIFDTRNY